MKFRYFVVYNLKLAHFLRIEELEWEKTEKFLDFVSPLAKSMGITICIENLYDGIGGYIAESSCCNSSPNSIYYNGPMI